MDSAPLIQQARQAMKAGQKQEAHRLLQQVVDQDPENYSAWLWLATVAPSPRDSLDYVKRAEALRPHHPTVQKARAWAEQRAAGSTNGKETTAVPSTAPQSQTVGWQPVALGGGFIMVVLALVLLAVFLLRNNSGAQPPAVVAGQLPAATATPEVTVAAGNLRPLPGNDTAPAAETAVATATFTPAPPRIQGKNVAANGGARATWTITPTPTDTPTPTPTYRPTFVSPQSQKPRGRPLGVRADERWIDVDLGQQTLYAYEGNELIYQTLISSGVSDYPTVTGQFRIYLSYESQTMDGRLLGYDYYLEDVPYVMYFYEDYALHGTFWHNNFGRPMSHGCVNMKTADAQWVFSWAGAGTLVNIHD